MDRLVGYPAGRAPRVGRPEPRFLLLHAEGKEPNLVSQTLAFACRELPRRWREHFGYAPLLAETFTDPESFEGTCYKASGWEAVDPSQGHSRHRADSYVPNQRPKRLWKRELAPKAREVGVGGGVWTAGMIRESRSGRPTSDTDPAVARRGRPCRATNAVFLLATGVRRRHGVPRRG